MTEWIDYCNTPLPHNLKFQNPKSVVEAMGRINDMNDVVVYVIEKGIFENCAFIKLIGTSRGWISVETFFFAVPLKMAREMLKLKMEEW